VGVDLLRELHPRRCVHRAERAEARELDRRRALRERYGVTRPSPVDPDAHAHVSERIAILRGALDEQELELALGRGASTDSRPS
jgi:hypothetical protein